MNSSELVWIYVAGLAVLVIGAFPISKQLSTARGLDRITLFGPVFLALPMAVFGADHFLFAKTIVPLVPSWIPGHLFWVIFVGVCLIAGALSLVLQRHAALAAALLAAMLFCFVLLIWIPAIVQQPGDRFGWAYGSRDLSFAAGALSFSAAQAPGRWTQSAKVVLTVTRLVLGIVAIFYAIEHFLHPEFVPGVPLELPAPLWLPFLLRVPLSYFTGLVLLSAGLALVLNKETKFASTALGVLIFLLVVVFYLPLVIAAPWAIENGLNYFADTLMYSGSLLCFAGAWGSQTRRNGA